jgi:hypothetical protein
MAPFPHTLYSYSQGQLHRLNIYGEIHAMQIVACYKAVRLLLLLSAPYFCEVFKHHTCLDRKISASE